MTKAEIRDEQICSLSIIFKGARTAEINYEKLLG